MGHGRGRAIAAGALLMVLAGCGDGADPVTPAAAEEVAPVEDVASAGAGTSADDTASAPQDVPVAFPVSDEPVPVAGGTYDVARSAWSIADYSVTLPEGWSVQYGHLFSKGADTEDGEVFVYPVVVGEIYADACAGNEGEVVEVGAGVEALVGALTEQTATDASEPVSTTLGGHPATRIDLTIPADLDLAGCSLGEVGLQVWYSEPADKYFVLLPGGTGSVYVVDVDGRPQVVLAHTRDTSDPSDVQELQGVLDSIRIGS